MDTAKTPVAQLCGLIVVDKPMGLSSMDVVRHVRRAATVAGQRAKTGHAGTLDPLATGVVICCLGKATKAVSQLMAMTKVYDAGIDLSAFTTTDDREGERQEVAVTAPPNFPAIEQACQNFLGQIEQTPPAYSAVHVNGQRAYKLARQGKSVAIKPRTVRIDAMEIVSYHWPNLHIRVTCGSGTYIRSIARDLGQSLGVGGHLAALRRSTVGRYDLSCAHTIERFEQPITQDDLLPIPSS